MSNENLLKPPVKAVVWDWNGTMLNDVHICVDSINTLLKQRKVPALNYHTYRGVFGFPVRDYYEKAGFDFNCEPFDVVAVEFIDIYRTHLEKCSLFPEVSGVLQQISESDVPQFVLSAMEQDLLESSLASKGIAGYFRFIAGTGDHYADGKEASARRLQELIDAKPHEILLVGDTIHDHEVADAMGWQCVLVSNGHQSEERLRETGRPVVGCISLIPAYLNGQSS